MFSSKSFVTKLTRIHNWIWEVNCFYVVVNSILSFVWELITYCTRKHSHFIAWSILVKILLATNITLNNNTSFNSMLFISWFYNFIYFCEYFQYDVIMLFEFQQFCHSENRDMKSSLENAVIQCGFLSNVSEHENNHRGCRKIDHLLLLYTAWNLLALLGAYHHLKHIQWMLRNFNIYCPFILKVLYILR